MLQGKSVPALDEKIHIFLPTLAYLNTHLKILIYVCTCSSYRGQQRVLDLLELVLQMVECWGCWELGSSATTASIPKC